MTLKEKPIRGKNVKYTPHVVDDYVNTKTLQLLSQKKQGVEVVLFTVQIRQFNYIYK